MWFIKLLLKIIFCFIAFVYVFYFIFLSEREVSLESDEAIKQWIGKEFEITKRLYIHRYNDDETGRYHLQIPPKNADFPEDMDTLLNDWPLIPGTHFKILKIFKRVKPIVGEFLMIEAILLDGDYKNLEVFVDDLFRYDFIDGSLFFQIFGPKEDVIRPWFNLP